MPIFALRTPRLSTYLLAVAAILPRLAVLVVERGNILTAYTEKSDDFAQTFVKSGTFGFVPGIPSANTQPLYAWFLIPLYWVFGRHWLVVGLAQIAVATATALVVYAIGRRVVPRFAALAAVVATLNPYLIWHDVHVNREITDQLVLALLVLSLLVALERNTTRWWVLVGALSGVAILGNTRLAALPLVLAAVAAWRRGGHRALAAVAIVLAAAAVVTPWVVRNKVQVGCFAITTDARALWKANNMNTYRVLAHGGWIDDVPPLPGAPVITPEYEWDFYRLDHKIVHVDECAQMRLYEHATRRFWAQHPGEKAKLMAQAARLLWDTRSHETQGRSGSGGWRDTARRVGEPAYLIPIYLLAIIGLFFAARAFVLIALVLLLYNTAAAMLFAGTTRYRVPFDFLLVLLAASAVERLWSKWRYTDATPSAASSAEN